MGARRAIVWMVERVRAKDTHLPTIHRPSPPPTSVRRPEVDTRRMSTPHGMTWDMFSTQGYTTERPTVAAAHAPSGTGPLPDRWIGGEGWAGSHNRQYRYEHVHDLPDYGPPSSGPIVNPNPPPGYRS